MIAASATQVFRHFAFFSRLARKGHAVLVRNHGAASCLLARPGLLTPAEERAADTLSASDAYRRFPQIVSHAGDGRPTLISVRGRICYGFFPLGFVDRLGPAERRPAPAPAAVSLK